MTLTILLIVFITLLPLAPLAFSGFRQKQLRKRLVGVNALREEPAEKAPEADLDVDQESIDKLSMLLESLSRVKPLQIVFAPKTELDKMEMKRLLAQAGWQQSWALEAYLSLRFLGASLGFLIGAGVYLGFLGLSNNSLAMGLLGALIGAAMPTAYIFGRRKQRQKQIFRALPDFLDLVVIAVEVGQGPDMAMREAAQEMNHLCPILGSELKIYFNQLDLGVSRRDALHDLGLRVGLSEMTSVVNTLIQASRFGSSVAASLGDLSQRMRVRLQQLAQEKAHQVAFKLIFPMVLFIFPGVFVALVGPAAIMIARDILSIR